MANNPTVAAVDPERAVDWCAYQRAGAAVSWLMAGQALTAAQAARRLGIGPRGARRMFLTLSGALPIYCDDDGLWRWVEDGEDGDGENSPSGAILGGVGAFS